jgi:hypothetical protein
MNWSQVATAMRDPGSPVAAGIDGATNIITAAICTLAGNQPATACTPTVQALEKKLAR